MAVNKKTLTNANSTLKFQCEGVYDQMTLASDFGADNRTQADARTIAESRVGVDGKLSVGYVANSQNFTVTLQPNSPTIEAFRNIMRHFDNNMEVIVMNFEQDYPSVRRKATFSGTMTSAPSMSGGGKLLAEETFTFVVDRAVEESY